MITSSPSVQPTPEREVELQRLGDEIAELAAHLDAATARLLDLIREFDARGGWGNGFRSCAEWLTWRIGLAPGAAREHVRVARALGTLLFNVKPWDPTIFAAVVLALALAGLVACIIPATRATRTDPVNALRYD